MVQKIVIKEDPNITWIREHRSQIANIGALEKIHPELKQPAPQSSKTPTKEVYNPATKTTETLTDVQKVKARADQLKALRISAGTYGKNINPYVEQKLLEKENTRQIETQAQQKLLIAQEFMKPESKAMYWSNQGVTIIQEKTIPSFTTTTTPQKIDTSKLNFAGRIDYKLMQLSEKTSPYTSQFTAIASTGAVADFMTKGKSTSSIQKAFQTKIPFSTTNLGKSILFAPFMLTGLESAQASVSYANLRTQSLLKQKSTISSISYTQPKGIQITETAFGRMGGVDYAAVAARPVSYSVRSTVKPGFVIGKTSGVIQSGILSPYGFTGTYVAQQMRFEYSAIAQAYPSIMTSGATSYYGTGSVKTSEGFKQFTFGAEVPKPISPESYTYTLGSGGKTYPSMVTKYKGGEFIRDYSYKVPVQQFGRTIIQPSEDVTKIIRFKGYGTGEFPISSGGVSQYFRLSKKGFGMGGLPMSKGGAAQTTITIPKLQTPGAATTAATYGAAQTYATTLKVSSPVIFPKASLTSLSFPRQRMAQINIPKIQSFYKQTSYPVSSVQFHQPTIQTLKSFQLLAPQQVSMQQQIPRSIQTPIFQYPTANIPFSPPSKITYGFNVPPPFILFPNLEMEERRSTRKLRGKQKKRYTPGYESFIFRIRGKIPKGVETTARIRPIPKGFKLFDLRKL